MTGSFLWWAPWSYVICGWGTPFMTHVVVSSVCLWQSGGQCKCFKPQRRQTILERWGNMKSQVCYDTGEHVTVGGKSNSWTSAWKTRKNETIPHEARWFALPTVGKKGFPFSERSCWFVLEDYTDMTECWQTFFACIPLFSLFARGLDDRRSVCLREVSRLWQTALPVNSVIQ